MSVTELSDAKLDVIIRKTYQAFFSPSKYEEKSNDREIIDKGNNYRLPFGQGEIAVTTWGKEGPAVLLLHGWGGARAQMTGFVNPLLAAGFRVVAYDQPAHGESDGKTTNVLEISPSVKIIHEKEGPFYAVMAHSFGTLAASYALTRLGVPLPSKLVYFGAFNRLTDAFSRFQVLAKVPDIVMNGVIAALYEKYNQTTLESIVSADLVRELNIPALIFHDVKDEVTPVEDSRAIARAWETAEYIETEGLGHRGALQSKEIHELITGFLKK